MSAGILDLGFGPHKGKREYSKGGCRECKRRKIKCDEGKPQCWQCARLRKECSYPLLGEKVARVSKKMLQRQEEEKEQEEGESQTSGSPLQTPAQTPNHSSYTSQSSHSSQTHVPQLPVQQAVGNAVPISTQLSPPVLNNPVQATPNGSYPLQSSYFYPHGSPTQYPPFHPQPRLQPHQLQSIPQPPHQWHPNLPQNNPYPLQNPQQVAQGAQSLPQLNQGPPNYPTSNHLKREFTGDGVNSGYAKFQKHSVSVQDVSPRLPDSPNNSSQSSSSVPNSVPKFTPSSIISLLNDVNTPNPIDQHLNSQSPNSIQTTISTTSNPLRAGSTNHDSNHQFPEPDLNDNMLSLFDQDDLNLLASDLNNMVNNIMFEANYNGKYSSRIERDTETLKSMVSDKSTPQQESPGSINQAHLQPLSTYRNSASSGQPHLPKNVPLDYIKVKKPQEKLYLEEFYNDFADILLPFSSWDDANNCYFNPARDIILQCASQESFLLAAVLAHGAKTSFLKNNSPEHEEAYCKYLSKCLKLLGPALSGDDKRGKDNLTSNIEAVLLTVLLLTSANAANPKQDWRPHLRGAKDILLKVSNHKIKSSKVLIFCKFWFVTLEILAGISSTLGGTLRTEEEIDSLITSGDEYEILVLKEIGLIVEGGFNVMAGYHNDSVNHIRDLIKILAKIRQDKSYKPDNDFEYLRLLSEFYKLTEIEFVNKKCVLTSEDFKDGKVPSGSLVDVFQVNQNNVIVSWKDASHQAYILGSIITILTKCFKEPHTSPQVQILSNKLTSIVSFLGNSTEAPKSLIKCSLMMVQWPMLVAGMNCTKEDQQQAIRTFFHLSGQVGSGSAKYALERVSRIWSMREKGVKVESDFEDDYNDVLSY